MSSVDSVLRFFAYVKTRPCIKNLWPQLLCKENPYPKQVIELRGQSKRAVTVILMEIFTRIALPQSLDLQTSGRDGSILYINYDGNPVTESFRNYLHKLISRYYNDIDSVDSIVGYTLDNLIVIDPNNLTPNSASYLKFEDLIIDKADICLIVIDSIDGYNPETSGEPTGEDATYMNKVSHLKLVLQEVNAVRIYLRREPSNMVPPPELFTNINTVLICNDFPPNGGVLVQFYENNKQHDILFTEECMLHN